MQCTRELHPLYMMRNIHVSRDIVMRHIAGKASEYWSFWSTIIMKMNHSFIACLRLSYSKGVNTEHQQPLWFQQDYQLNFKELNTNTASTWIFSFTVGKSGSIWAPWSVMSIFSSPWLHNRQVVMRYSASVKCVSKTRMAFCCSWFDVSFLPRIHRIVQMEVAKHCRPALHNLRTKEGGSASHYTRSPRDAAVMSTQASEHTGIHLWIHIYSHL